MLKELNKYYINHTVIKDVIRLYKQIDINNLDVNKIATKDYAIYTILHIETFKDLSYKFNVKGINKNHDLDKLALYIVTDSNIAHNLHKGIMKHHNPNCLEENVIREEILDWESAQYTKLDKPLTAYEWLMQSYQGIETFPLFEKELKKLGLWENHSQYHLTEKEFNEKWNTITDEKLKSYLVKAYNYLGKVVEELERI